MHTPPMAAITGLSLYSTVWMTVNRCGWAPDWGTEFADIRAARETGTGADQDDCIDRRIGVRPFDAIDDRLANSSPRLFTGGLSNLRMAIPLFTSKPALFVLI